MEVVVSLIDLLKAGSKIKFPSGYTLLGVPHAKIIQCYTNYELNKKDGIVNLTEEGIEKALNRKDSFEKLMNLNNSKK
jgi:hypothetical protein